jgi:hypothetical protein
MVFFEVELDAKESVRLKFQMTVMADEASPELMLALCGQGTGSVAVAPFVVIDIPNTDNCGQPEGIRVRGNDGTVKVEKPEKAPALLVEVLGALLKIGS